MSTKHIPRNSITIIIKFNTEERKVSLIEDREFQKAKARLECIAIQKGAKCEYFAY